MLAPGANISCDGSAVAQLRGKSSKVQTSLPHSKETEAQLVISRYTTQRLSQKFPKFSPTSNGSDNVNCLQKLKRPEEDVEITTFLTNSNSSQTDGYLSITTTTVCPK